MEADSNDISRNQQTVSFGKHVLSTAKHFHALFPSRDFIVVF